MVTPIDAQPTNNRIGTGFRNYRNDCFLNATLQALFHAPSVINCIQEIEYQHYDCVTCSLGKTFIETRTGSRAIFPSYLYGLLKIRHRNLLNGEHQDAHNFLLSLLESTNEIQHNIDSIPSKFQGEATSTVVCFKCRRESFQELAFFTLQIDIYEPCIQDAFDNFFEMEKIEYFCGTCKKHSGAVKGWKITHAPTILCLQLKRFSGVSKKEDFVDISCDLSLSKDQQKNISCDLNYRLTAIINHKGLINFGHYTTTAFENGILYEFDDAAVKRFPFSHLIGNSDAYILLYELQNREDYQNIRNTERNEHMANDISDEHLDKKLYDFVDASNKECNVHMANDISEDASKVECNEHMASDIQTNEWMKVEIIGLDDDDTLEWLNNISTDHTENVEMDQEFVGHFDAPNTERNEWSATIGLDDHHTEHLVHTEFSQPENKNQSLGRRIIDHEYLFNQLEKHTDMICKLCHKGIMNFYEEFRSGIASTFRLICTDCGSKKKIYSDQYYRKDQPNVNQAAALGIVSVGLGFYHLEEFFCNLNIPCMSYQTYYRMDKKFQKYWWTLAKKLQEEALNEEIRLAKGLNETDSAGNALIAVKADGSWQKRSYGSNYSSLAGYAAIIGIRTNKILYMVVKNKYCHICKIAQSKTTPPNFHECNANYTGPSSGMENLIIVEGFKYCEERGARFNKFIGDGDSNTYKSLKDLRLYKNPDVYIDKYDCCNHLDKNFGKKFIALTKNTKFQSHGRNLLSRKLGQDISKGVRMAAIHWKKTNLTQEEKCSNLERDCMNAPLHCIGVHDNCAEYFCNKSTTPEARNFLTQLKNYGLYLAILNLCQYYFANKAKSLLAGYDNNVAENYNSLISKYLGGKRVNNALAGSYKGRTAIAAVHYNTKGQSASTFQKFIYNNPQPATLKLEGSRKRKLAQNAIRNQNKPKKRRTNEIQGTKKKRRPYGEGHEDLDFSPSKLQLAKQNLLQSLDENRYNRLDIQIQTTGQLYNTRWSEVRQNLLTSSYFGRILNSRSRKSYQKIVDDILYHNMQYSNTAEQVHQSLYENEALDIFCKEYNAEPVHKCGIFIDAEYSFLAASPFRLYGQDGIVMVQCPKVIFKKNIIDSINKKKIPFWTVTSEGIDINVKSHWYIQLQGQLHIADKKFAYLVVYLGESQSEYKIQKVDRDDAFWAGVMRDELVFFFNEAMVKELVNSRDERCMELRKYDEESQTFI